MSTSNARDQAPRPQESQTASSPPSRGRSTHGSQRPTQVMGTGFPPNMEGPYPAFTQIVDTNLPRGNRSYDFMMRNVSTYGIFLPYSRKANSKTPITLDVNAIRGGIRTVLRTAITRALYLKGHTNPTDIQTLSQNTAAELTNGCMMMLYQRLRAVNKSYLETYETYVMKPHMPEHFEVPTPYAIAFQNLGLFRVENMPNELSLVPTITTAAATNYCLGTLRWSPPAYQSAMEFAKTIGISFKGIDQSVKLGSAWWLLKSVDDEDDYHLTCCLPESNYTKEDAVIRTLWCANETGNFHSDIADLSSLTLDRGTYLRLPPPDVAVTSFYGMMETPETIWDIS